jgi:hypothetical protein
LFAGKRGEEVLYGDAKYCYSIENKIIAKWHRGVISITGDARGVLASTAIHQDGATCDE